MPRVLAKATLIYGGKEVHADILLNTGGEDIELALPRSLAKKLGLRPRKKVSVRFGARTHDGKADFVKTVVENPKTALKRESVLEAIVLPDQVLDCPLLGIVGQEKLRIAPNTPTGEVIFVV